MYIHGIPITYVATCIYTTIMYVHAFIGWVMDIHTYVYTYLLKKVWPASTNYGIHHC